MTLPARISPRFWDFTWSGTDVADALQAQAIYTQAFMDAMLGTKKHINDAEFNQLLILQTGMAAQRAWEHMSDPNTRVVMVTPEQFKGLPTPDNALEFALDVKPPFPITYFDLAGPSGMGGVPIELCNPSEEDGGTGREWVTYLTGVIFVEHSDALSVIPILRERKTLKHGMHILVPSCVGYYAGEPLEKITLCDVLVTAEGVIAADVESKMLKDHHRTAKHLAAQCLPLLMLLESVNVDLEDAPLKPKQAKVAQQKARTRPLVVAVRRKTRRAPKVATGAEPIRKLSVQVEVRGHFKHHGPGTPVFKAAERCQPEKIKTRAGRGPCVRFWCPPFIMGPVDAPLVIKARRISGEDARIA